ncbi:DEKNAAC103720 [Brettanomyces naardenensis]|uniref:DEKNAAC103720 n=1 Tax=Brettanomyces naardenensis TaxID=13370 RepID=A0A448YN92_BRENA|nr:DEKNAAC103720 [Brettanomyces naardenensis]
MASTSIPSTQKVVLFNKNGGPEVLEYTDFAVPEISDSEVLIKNRYAGINFVESYFRIGLYPSKFPHVLGREATGAVVKVGKNVKNLSVGDKVAYLSGGTFAQYTKFPADGQLIKLGAKADDEKLKLYAASLLQGLTALALVDEAYPVKAGDYILVTAAAGGVGLILDQLISKDKKAHVIAVASTDEKLAKAKANGAELLLNSKKLSQDEILAKINEFTKGKGVAASFDSVGKDTLDLSLAALGRNGILLSFGNASGAVPPFSIRRLAAKNLKIARPSLNGFIEEPEEFQYYSHRLFDLIDNKQLNIDLHKVYPLSEYRTATEDLEGRKTTGKLVLEIPN